MLIHLKSTLHVLHMLMHLSSGHVTLLLSEFHPLSLSAIGLTAPSGLTLGFAPNF